jgi:hypothetical protein
MRRRHLLWIASWIVLGLSACATSHAPRPDLRSDIAKACADWRWIGIKSTPDAQCPDFPGWTVRPLFSVKEYQEESKDNPAAAAPATHKTPYPDPGSRSKEIRELNRFCVYETDPDRKLGDLSFPPAAAPGLVRFDQDCAALSYTADKIAATDWEPISEHFLAQAGRPATPLRIRNRQGVRLAFLDTQPTGVGVPREPGRSEHGYTLAHIARHLVCSPADSDDCAAQITTRLALSVTRFDAKDRAGTETDTKRGGYIGTQSDLAEAIQSEVDDWQAHFRQKGWPEHLVLNLSLGWDGELFGGLDENQVAELRAGAQAVYRALRYAASFDALVLAAAGNARDCPGQTKGPLLPAAWEAGAPAEESCSKMPPLLYAVGGVDAENRPLVNARPGGMPRRAAYGENGIVADWEPGRSTMMYTGSSVATAVASSIAAIVWDTVPTLDSSGVMSLLDVAPAEQEEILPLHADFWFGANASTIAVDAPPIRRLSLCAVLSRACARTDAVNCPLQSPCGPSPYEQTKLQLPLPGLVAKTNLFKSCHPWIVPQPEAEPCPVCKPPRE